MEKLTERTSVQDFLECLVSAELKITYLLALVLVILWSKILMQLFWERVLNNILFYEVQMLFLLLLESFLNLYSKPVSHKRSALKINP